MCGFLRTIRFSQRSHTFLHTLTPNSQAVCYDKVEIRNKEGTAMLTAEKTNDCTGLIALCNTVKDLLCDCEFAAATTLIAGAMGQHPHAPEPHNLMGLLLEREGDHLAAVKHFRAAWALDPTYLPARYNLSQYADLFCSARKDAYLPEDCPQEQYHHPCKIVYDENGIGHVLKV